jgi:predicted transcriptional regulator of viral defense system
MQKSKYKIFQEMVNQAGLISVDDLKKRGIPREYLSRLGGKNGLEMIAPGVYSRVNSDITEKHTYAQVSKIVPKGVICLFSAMRFHEFSTQNPNHVWIGIDVRARKPKVTAIKIKFVRYSGPAFTDGITKHLIEGVSVKVYNPAKTVADCFKYRHKIGLDVALEALKDGYRKKKFTMDELWKYAKICRVANVMRPYMESL